MAGIAARVADGNQHEAACALLIVAVASLIVCCGADGRWAGWALGCRAGRLAWRTRSGASLR